MLYNNLETTFNTCLSVEARHPLEDTKTGSP